MKRLCRFLLGLLPVVSAVAAEAPPPPASGVILRFTATTANVSGAPDSIRIDLFRWSTDAERSKLMDAWNLKPGAVSGRGSGKGGRGAAGRGKAPAPAADPVAGNDDPPARAAGRGRSEQVPANVVTPEGNFAAALKEAATVGYLWSSEIAGYALRYAGRTTLPDGSGRIVLITDRRLGAVSDLWKPVGSVAPSSYDFSIIEVRVNSKGEGEGRVSVTGRVAPDAASGMVTLTDYSSGPAILTSVRSQNGK